MKQVFDPSWRTAHKGKRRFYARYMRWLEVIGYSVVLLVVGAFIAAFNYPVEDLVTADKVKIEPLSTPVMATEDTLVVDISSGEDAPVKRGTLLIGVVQGTDVIGRYQAWSRVNELKPQLGKDEFDAMLRRFPRPDLTPILSPTEGTFRPTAEVGAIVRKDEELGRVVDYDDLRLSASLAGQTVPQAKVGQIGRITSIAIETEAGVLFRGSAGKDTVVSGSLFGAKFKEMVQGAVIGREVKVRDDVPLKITEVSEVQIDAGVSENSGHGDQVVALDPPASLTIPVQVISGAAMATVQIADLPKDVQDQANNAVAEALRSTNARTPGGSTVALADPKDVRFVLKVKADQGTATGSALSGTALSRTFDAKLQVANPPQFLIDAVRKADHSGKTVTARVELPTGSRPIAFILLRKS